MWLDNPNYTDKDFNCWLRSFLTVVAAQKTSQGIWIDVGANYGNVTDLILSVAKDDQVWIFEPHPKLYPILCSKYKENKNVIVWPLALDNCIKNSSFMASDIDCGTSFLRAAVVDVNLEEHYSVPVTVTTLDSLNYPTNVKFIKIDTEGNDFLIMQGAKKLMETHRPLILFEFTGLIGCRIAECTPAQWYKLFQEAGYHLRSCCNGYDDKYIIKNFNIRSPELFNIIAIPNEYTL